MKVLIHGSVPYLCILSSSKRDSDMFNEVSSVPAVAHPLLLCSELGFSFPLTLSTIHFVISSIGAYIFLRVLKVSAADVIS